jgi:hypothetical protein
LRAPGKLDEEAAEKFKAADFALHTNSVSIHALLNQALACEKPSSRMTFGT